MEQGTVMPSVPMISSGSMARPIARTGSPQAMTPTLELATTAPAVGKWTSGRPTSRARLLPLTPVAQLVRLSVKDQTVVTTSLVKGNNFRVIYAIVP